MKLSKGILAIITGAMTLSGVASAQVATEKTGPLQTILPDLYGNVEVRHATNRRMENDEVVGITPVLSVRPQIGTTMAKGKLDTSFTWIFEKRAENSVIRKHKSVPLYNETSYTLLKSESGNFLNAYAYTEMPNAGDYSISEVGFDSSYAYTVDTVIGAIEFKALETPQARFYSGKKSKDAKLKAANGGDSGYSLAAGEEAPEIERKEPDIINYAQLGVKLKPAGVKGLAVGFASEIDRNFEAKYKYDVGADNKAENVEKDGYLATTLIINKYSVSYALNDKITIGNTLRQYINGFYEERMNDSDGIAPRWENRLYMTAPLF